MADIKWIKTYEVKVDLRTFRVFVSEHEEGGFRASCLWYEKGRAMRAPGSFGSMNFRLEQRHGSTEQEAVSEITNWLNSTFPDAGQLTLVQG
jgi:hypothetical protein